MAEGLASSTPNIPRANFIVEPVGKDSGPAAGIGIYQIAKQDPQAVVAVLSADHHIADEAQFRESLRCAALTAQQGYIVTLGIEPTFPSTGFGYIQRGELIQAYGDLKAYHSLGFKEKPNDTLAAQFVLSGQYSWNAGMFILTVQQAIAEFSRQQPAMHQLLSQIAADPAQLDALWGQVEKISLDYAVMEGAERIAIMPVSIGWSDVGTWSALFDVLERDEHRNALRTDSDDHIMIDTRNTLIVSEGHHRMVVTIGVENLVVIATDDALLVSTPERAQEVKQVVDQLKARQDHRV
jgi:mannose-1-phosphate guanylyltransferase